LGAIHRIANSIEKHNKNTPSTDIVMIYYQGAELIQRPTGFYLTTRQSRDAEVSALLREPKYLETSAVASSSLRDLVEAGPGAYLLLLDVKRTFGEANPQGIWQRGSRAAVMRHAWLKEQQMPPEARLISALERNMPKVRELEQILIELDSDYQQMAATKFPGSLKFEHQVPNMLKSLTLGGP
jgi:hypothetical protein